MSVCRCSLVSAIDGLPWAAAIDTEFRVLIVFFSYRISVEMWSYMILFLKTIKFFLTDALETVNRLKLQTGNNQLNCILAVHLTMTMRHTAT